MSRKDEPGWVKIGATCSAGRRSLWMRVNLRDGEGWATGENVASIELCAGREGDDAYVRFENDGSRQFYDLWDVLGSAEFAAGT